MIELKFNIFLLFLAPIRDKRVPAWYHRRVLKSHFLGLSIALIFVGCTSSVKIPEVKESDPDLERPIKAWAKVLKTYVDEQGRVDFHELDQNRAKLEVFVKYISQVSIQSHPEKFFTRDEKIAYLINSYNALAMYGVLEYGIPESLSGITKMKFFYFRKYTIGGQEMSLHDFENDIIRPFKEERVYFALNNMTVSAPRLPRVPFASKNLVQQLEREAKYFFNEKRNASLDQDAGIVYLSEIMDTYEDEFLAKSETLVRYVNQYSRIKYPVSSDFDTDFVDYNWEINIRKPEAASP